MEMSQAQLQMQKAILWEEAKGKLRALAAVEGHRRLCQPMTAGMANAADARFDSLYKRVEDFISDIEDHGLNE